MHYTFEELFIDFRFKDGAWCHNIAWEEEKHEMPC